MAGTIFCVIGATVITLYKGPTIYTPSNHVNSTATLITEVTTTPMIDFGTWSLSDAEGKKTGHLNVFILLIIVCLGLVGLCFKHLSLRSTLLVFLSLLIRVSSVSCNFLLLLCFAKEMLKLGYSTLAAKLSPFYTPEWRHLKLLLQHKYGVLIEEVHCLLLCTNVFQTPKPVSHTIVQALRAINPNMYKTDLTFVTFPHVLALSS